MLTISFDVTITIAILNASSNKEIDMTSIASLINYYGSQLVQDVLKNGETTSKELFKLDGTGKLNGKESDIEIKYDIRINFQARAVKSAEDVKPNEDILVIKDKMRLGQQKDALGCAPGGLAVFMLSLDPKKDIKAEIKLASVGLHELLHHYGLDDAYEVDINGKVTFCNEGNVMGCGYQDISLIKITPDQGDDIAKKLIRTIETMKLHKSSYEKLHNTTSKSAAKAAVAK